MAIVRKKPVEVEARQLSEHNIGTIRNWIRVYGGSEGPGNNATDIRLNTLEGLFLVRPGDWIIKGVRNEFYRCDPDIFDETYEIIREK